MLQRFLDGAPRSRCFTATTANWSACATTRVRRAAEPPMHRGGVADAAHAQLAARGRGPASARSGCPAPRHRALAHRQEHATCGYCLPPTSAMRRPRLSTAPSSAGRAFAERLPAAATGILTTGAVPPAGHHLTEYARSSSSCCRSSWPTWPRCPSAPSSGCPRPAAGHVTLRVATASATIRPAGSSTSTSAVSPATRSAFPAASRATLKTALIGMKSVAVRFWLHRMDAGNRQANADHIRARRIHDLVAPALRRHRPDSREQRPDEFHAHGVGQAITWLAFAASAPGASISLTGSIITFSYRRSLTLVSIYRYEPSTPSTDLSFVVVREKPDGTSGTGAAVNVSDQSYHRSATCQHGTCRSHRPTHRLAYALTPLFRSPTDMPRF